MLRSIFWITICLLLAGCNGGDNNSSNPKNCINGAELIRDASTSTTITMLPDTTTIKTWRVRNTGTCTWNEDYKITQISGTAVTSEPAINRVAKTPPQGELLITLTLRMAANTPMSSPQSADFRLTTPNDEPFGPTLHVQAFTGRPTATPGTTPLPPSTAAPITGPNCVNNAQFVADVTIPDGTTVVAGQPFEKRWRYRNTGTCTWNNSYRLVQITGSSITMNSQIVNLPPAVPNQEVEIRVTLTVNPGTPLGSEVRADFELRAPDNTAFGSDPPYVRLITVSSAPTAIPGATTAACTNNAIFVADVTIPDGAVVPRGQPFVKTWRLQNTGTCPWDSSYTLIKIVGDEMTAAIITLPSVNPGATVELSASITLSPQALAGQAYTAVFQLYAPNGEAFGVQPFVQVVAGP